MDFAKFALLLLLLYMLLQCCQHRIITELAAAAAMDTRKYVTNLYVVMCTAALQTS